MDEDRVRVDGFLDKTDVPAIKTGDVVPRPTKHGRRKGAKQTRLFAKDGEEKQLRVVYACPQHSDEVLKALIELLASTLREKRGEE